jgi:hypothetical protein
MQIARLAIDHGLQQFIDQNVTHNVLLARSLSCEMALKFSLLTTVYMTIKRRTSSVQGAKTKGVKNG